jgi:Protein of unknown function (DUF2721)
MTPDALTLSNPFAALGAIAGPAILTNACSVLALGTGNRLGRVVDRTRIVVREISSSADDADRLVLSKQLGDLDVRAQMLLRALRSFYAGLGLFAAAAFLSAIGSALAIYERHVGFRLIAIIALVVGAAAVFNLVRGCVEMTRETRLAVRTLEEEASSRTAGGSRNHAV